MGKAIQKLLLVFVKLDIYRFRLFGPRAEALAISETIQRSKQIFSFFGFLPVHAPPVGPALGKRIHKRFMKLGRINKDAPLILVHFLGMYAVFHESIFWNRQISAFKNRRFGFGRQS
ncbi:hypothetical protein [Desulfococcus sp.]|uniref:hypothetical protein n=1 Tax=Desulfococcus sp. TaxID=2025834 RepID=UPI0035931469